jgi:hypothetical protein
MVPKPGDSLFRQTVIAEPSAISIENGELVLGHDVGRRLRLDTAPYFTSGPFKYRIHSRGRVAILVVPNDLECLG